ncbi:MAG: protein kinase [Gemmatimonadaceae bacterium]
MQLIDPLFLELQDALAGEYSLERELGRGGMGVVYLAREVQLDRLVAIKVLPRVHAGTDATRERFLREARTAAHLFHPNIVPIYRVGTAAGLPYFVMAYVDGETLGERLRRRGPVTSSAMTDILRDVAQALGYAHGRGVVHRDVKPDNILLERESGRALVSDFGIASRIDYEDHQLMLAGTAQFMSPEQLQGQPVDGRADLYALGLVAFLALSGKLPSDASSSVALSIQQSGRAPHSLASIAPELPSSLIHAIDTCLMQDISERWVNAEALISALEPDRHARAELPAELRDWARPSWLVGVLPVWVLGEFVIHMYASNSSDLGRLAASLYFFTRTAAGMVVFNALPLMSFGVIRIRRTRALLASGHSLTDLRFALQKHRAATGDFGADDSLQNENRSRRLIRRVMLPAVTITAIAVVVNILWGYPVNSGVPRTNLPLPFPRQEFLHTFSFIGKWAYMIVATGTIALGTLSAGVLPPRLHQKVFGRIRERFWKSRAGAWLAAKLTPNNRQLLSADFRPTEMAVGSAADELFAALPTAYRESLAEVPSIVVRLTTRAGALREQIEELSELIRQQGAAGEEALGSSVREARAALSETVTALERMRLDLLRLHGGLNDIQPITTTMNAAKLISSHVERLRSAERELEMGSPIRIDMRTPTPV